MRCAGRQGATGRQSHPVGARLLVALATACALPPTASAADADPNYPPAIRQLTFCSVPNYRLYRLTPTAARGFKPDAGGGGPDPLACGQVAGQADGCFCADDGQCASGFCVPDETPGPTLGISMCSFPIVQIAEVEFWRGGAPVRTAKVPDEGQDMVRLVNGASVSKVWGVWEVEFFLDTGCTVPAPSGTPIASSQRQWGFGHSIDHTAPGGAHDTPRTDWQEDFDAKPRRFGLHGPAEYAFDGDEVTNWWPTCGHPCRANSEWIGLDFGAPLPAGQAVRCARVLQDKDKDYASFSLIIEGHQPSSASTAGAPEGWHALAKFHAATWDYGGVWERLPVPQGVAFPASTAHARLVDGDLSSSAAGVANEPITFDFGVEVEVDGWRWATAAEPSDFGARRHDGRTCNADGKCPRDPVRWRLDGSLDGQEWYNIQERSTDFDATVYRMRWTQLMPLSHRTPLSVEDVWPDGRGRCAKRR